MKSGVNWLSPVLNEFAYSVVRHVPYIHQGHGIKGLLSLDQLMKKFPHWEPKVWEKAMHFLETDEPKVSRLFHKDFETLEKIVDPTEGRDFGPNHILGEGIYPLSYWAMWKKYQELGLKNLLLSYVDKAVDRISFLGHEISILSAYLEFSEVIQGNEELELYTMERFTEFMTASYLVKVEASATDGVDPEISELSVLKACLTNPSFYGHNILAFCWLQRGARFLNAQQYRKSLQAISKLSKKNPKATKAKEMLAAVSVVNDEEFEKALLDLFVDGPPNNHQYTLSAALSNLWDKYPEKEIRHLILANTKYFKDTPNF